MPSKSAVEWLRLCHSYLADQQVMLDRILLRAALSGATQRNHVINAPAHPVSGPNRGEAGMALSLKEGQAITELADQLHSFLPGTPHPHADQNLSFPRVAAKLGLTRTGVCRAGPISPSRCEMVTRPSFSSPNQPDQDRTTAYRNSSGSNSQPDAHCVTIVGEWEEPSWESRFKGGKG